MKKTLNINIGNSIIHIEEDAYEVLTVYLNDIKAHFARNADDFEIVTDIENRIAEMFREILTEQQKQAINITDVNQIIAQMGTVKDFESTEEDQEEAPFVNSFNPGIKRLYRDMDNVMVAGVCSGLGHYLDVEARWIRLVTLLSVLVGGAGILAYLVAWIIIPRAQTRSEKMSMKGEAINLQGFIRNFQEELENHHLFKRSGTFISEFFAVFGNFLNGTGKVIIKITAGFIIFMCAVMLVSTVFTGAMFFGIFDSAANEIFPLSMVDDGYVSWLLLSCFVLIAVPLLALILFSVRVAFNGRPIHRNVSFGLLIIWLAALGGTTFLIAKTSTEFKEHTEITQVKPLKSYRTLSLELDNSKVFTKEDSVRYHISGIQSQGQVILDDRDGPFQKPDDVKIRIEKSLDGKYSVVQTFGANGKTFDKALMNAQSIKYDFLQQDSLLKFSSRLNLKQAAKWRNQEVTITVKVPEGTTLLLSRDLDPYLDNYRSWDCDQEEGHDGQQVEWVMTENGLKCKYEKAGKDQDEH